MANTLLTWSDLVDYRGFYTDLYNQTRRSLDAGLSAEEAIAAYEKPARYSEYAANKGGAGFTVDAIVNYIYAGIGPRPIRPRRIFKEAGGRSQR